MTESRNALAGLSKSAVDRAGEALREHALGNLDLESEELAQVRKQTEDFRQAHGGPMRAVKSNLSYYVAQVSEISIVSQRLKRLPTIEDKLVRHPTMRLSSMQDIAGCRAVLATEAELRLVEARLRGANGWEIKPDTPFDYIACPKTDGYRALHLIERRHGCQVEVQLRTLWGHAWAEMIEAADRQSRYGALKLGRAPDHLRDYYALGADLLAARERGEEPDAAKLAEFRSMYRKMQERSSKRRR